MRNHSAVSLGTTCGQLLDLRLILHVRAMIASVDKKMLRAAFVWRAFCDEDAHAGAEHISHESAFPRPAPQLPRVVESVDGDGEQALVDHDLRYQRRGSWQVLARPSVMGSRAPGAESRMAPGRTQRVQHDTELGAGLRFAGELTACSVTTRRIREVPLPAAGYVTRFSGDSLAARSPRLRPLGRRPASRVATWHGAPVDRWL